MLHRSSSEQERFLARVLPWRIDTVGRPPKRGGWWWCSATARSGGQAQYFGLERRHQGLWTKSTCHEFYRPPGK